MTFPRGILDTDRVSPTGGFTSPAPGNVSGVITLAVNAADNDVIANVQFQVDGTNIGAPDTVAPFTINHDTRTILNGSHTYMAVMTDRVGNITVVSVSVTVANLPLVTLTAPASGATVAGVITVSANITSYDSSISVQFKRDGVNIGGSVTVAPFQVNYDTTALGNGSHSFSVTATDGHGNTASDSHSVTVTNVPPAIPNSTGPNGTSDGDSGPTGPWSAFFNYGTYKANGFTLQYRVFVNFQNSDEGKGINATTTFNDGSTDQWQDHESSGGNDGSVQNWYSPWVNVPISSSVPSLRVQLSLIRDFGGSTITGIGGSHIEYKWV